MLTGALKEKYKHANCGSVCSGHYSNDPVIKSFTYCVFIFFFFNCKRKLKYHI